MKGFSIMKVLKYLLYYLLTALYSVLIGFIAWSFLFIVNTVTHFLWIGEEGSGAFMYDHTYLIFPLIFIGSMMLAYVYNRFEVIPRPGIKYAKEFKEHHEVKYQDFFKIYILAMIPLFLGASVGPEAALVGLFFMLASYIGDVTDRIQAKLGIEIIDKPQATFVDNLKVNRLYMLKIFVIYGVVGYTLENLLDFDKYPSFNVVLDPISIASPIELIAILPLVVVGYLLAKFYALTEHPIERLMTRFTNRYVKMTITAIVLSIFAYIFPMLIMSGEATLHILVDNPLIISGGLLIILSLLKVIITHVCIAGDLRGGHIFPIIFSAFLMGAGISAIFNIDSTLAICAVTAATTLTIFSNYIAAFLLLALFFPLKLLTLIFIVIIIIGEGKAAAEGRNEL